MDHRSSTASVATRNLRTLTRMKRVKVFIAFSVLLVIYIALFASDTTDNVFLIAGGFLGGVSALLVITDGIIQRIHGSNLAMLFWRSSCDLGLAIRFILNPAFNYYVCGAFKCDRDVDENPCQLPAAMLQFFLVASEMWFLCNAVDLYYSITNPFSSFKSRIKYYHVLAWTMALLVSLVPLSLTTTSHKVYGFWYVNAKIADSNICWLNTGTDKLGFSVWALFLVPLAIIYIICLVALVVAYTRLRKGLPRTFLPKMKLLVTNTINVLVLALFWAIFLFLYAWTFLTRNEEPPNKDLNSLLYFTLASKGFSSLFVWIFVSDYNMKALAYQQDETVDTNVALREEVLTFATAGIRSSARDGEKATPDKAQIVRIPEQARLEDANIIGMLFYFKFLMGYSEEIRAVEMMMKRKRRSIHTDFGRQTFVRGDSQRTDAPALSIAEAAPSFSEVSKEQRSTDVGEPSVLDMVEVREFNERPSAPGPKRTSVDMHMHVSESTTPRGSMAARNWLFHLRQYIQSKLAGDAYDEVQFTEFQPFQFRRIRQSCGVTDEIYQSAFSTTIKERLTEGGASGAFFFFSKGENFIAKSCTEAEVNVLKNNAQQYADFLIANPDSYISKILGVYQLRIYGNSLNFFVMNNLFFNNLGLTMNEKYDIKGSFVARNAKPPLEGRSLTCSYCEQKYVYKKKKNFSRYMVKSSAPAGSSKSVFEVNSQDSKDGAVSPMAEALANLEEGGGSDEISSQHCRYTVSGMHEPNVILKDNDLKFKIRLPLDTAVDVVRQLRKDAEFLASLGIMDYSLLLGVHNTVYEVQPIRLQAGSNGGEREASDRPSMLRRASQSSVPFSSPAGASTGGDSESENGGTAQPSVSRETEFVASDDGSHTPNGPGRLQRRRTLTHAQFRAATPPSAEPNSPDGVSLTKMLEVYRVVGPDTYFMGIIDFQQQWNWAKQMERFFKVRVQGADADGLSAVEPEQYKERFVRKVEDIIDIDTQIYK